MSVSYSQMFFGGLSLSDLAEMAANVLANGVVEVDEESNPTGWKHQDFELNELNSADCSQCSQNTCKQRLRVHTSGNWSIEHEVP